MNVGENIRELRKSEKMTMKELGEKVGISEQGIGNYERGDRNPSLDILEKIATALHVELDYLLDLKKSFSSKLITSILRIDYITIAIESEDYGFETIAHHTGISIDSLKNCIEENIDLSIEDQLNLIEFWGDWACPDDGIEFEDFVNENYKEINKNPLLSSKTKTILNLEITKTSIEKLYDLLEKHNFKVTISKREDQNLINICNGETTIITEFESNLMTVYDEIITKINSYSKFIIEDELRKFEIKKGE